MYIHIQNMFQRNKLGGLLMKKIIISIIFVFTLIIGCIGYVASASVDSLNDIGL